MVAAAAKTHDGVVLVNLPVQDFPLDPSQPETHTYADAPHRVRSELPTSLTAVERNSAGARWRQRAGHHHVSAFPSWERMWLTFLSFLCFRKGPETELSLKQCEPK